VTAVYATLFGTGRLLFGDTLAGILWIALAVAAFAWIARGLSEPEVPLAGDETGAPAIAPQAST
jgi:hypothetical protein